MYLRWLRLSIGILFLLSFLEGRVQFPPTPCRSVFNYKVRNGTNEAYGYLKFTNDLTGDYQLEVRMSVARRLPWNIGIFRLPTEDQIQCGADLEYEVTFPPCDGLIPVLTYVKFNNKIYCTGPPERDASGRGTSNFLEYDGLVTDMFENTCETSTNKQTTATMSQTPVTVDRSDNVSVSPPTNIIWKQQDGCGILQEINGREHFPWLATIYQAYNNSVRYFCSGTLISNSHVLTVAPCVDKAETNKLTIRIGRNNIKELIPSNITTVRNVKSVNVHPMWMVKRNGSNIAVIELDHPVEYSDLIRPACLWNETEDLNKVIGEQAIVIGWGLDAKPKKFTMPIVSWETCLLSNRAFAYYLDDTSFCAGFRNGTVACSGNSGGSLLLRREDGRYYLRGLTATALVGPDGRGCDAYSFNTFTDVAKFSNWISSIINKNI